jgi:hypothetical protein
MTKEYQFNLTRADKASALWIKIQAHFAHQLAKERIKNDARASAEDTAYTRGKIAMLKELTKLDEVARPESDDDDSDEYPEDKK